MPSEFKMPAAIQKVDSSLGLVLGYAVICAEDGEPYSRQ